MVKYFPLLHVSSLDSVSTANFNEPLTCTFSVAYVNQNHQDGCFGSIAVPKVCYLPTLRI